LFRVVTGTDEIQRFADSDNGQNGENDEDVHIISQRLGWRLSHL
jgi:hypothetical protein